MTFLGCLLTHQQNIGQKKAVNIHLSFKWGERERRKFYYEFVCHSVIERSFRLVSSSFSSSSRGWKRTGTVCVAVARGLPETSCGEIGKFWGIRACEVFQFTADSNRCQVRNEFHEWKWKSFPSAFVRQSRRHEHEPHLLFHLPTQPALTLLTLSLYFMSPSRNRYRPWFITQPLIGALKSNIWLYCLISFSKFSLFESCYR